MSDPEEVAKIIHQLHELNEADASLIEALDQLGLARETEQKDPSSEPHVPERAKRG